MALILYERRHSLGSARIVNCGNHYRVTLHDRDGGMYKQRDTRSVVYALKLVAQMCAEEDARYRNYLHLRG